MSVKNSGMIVRPHIKQIWEELSEERIIYVCAPAGYGKTAAIRQWLDSVSTGAAVALDEYDNNLLHFCERFCKALQICQPQNPLLAEIASHSSFGGAPDEFVIRAIAALSVRKRAVLVLEDLHFVTNTRVLRLLLILLKRLPDNIQIILSSRHGLPPGFSDLWIRGQLVRVTAEQLRFSEEDIQLLYKKRGYPITSEKAGEILRFTDGWAIGVGAMMLSAGNPHGETMEYLDAFIYENVWQHWDEEMREFMLRTAVVRDMTPSLCAALTGNPNSAEVLEQLLKQNAFLFSTRSGVYRYHQLFHDCLNHMLAERDEELTRSLLEKAGGWYLSQQDFHSAVECFIRCENHEGIIQCIGILTTQGREYVPVETLFGIARSPAVFRTAEKYPYLYSMLAWAAFSEGRADDMAEYSDRYYSLQPEIIRLNPSLAHSIMYVRLVDFRNSFIGLLGSASEMANGLSKEQLSDMRATLGTLNQNLPLLHRGTRDFSECAAGSVESDIPRIVGAVGGLFGDEARLLEECLMAGLYYEQGHLEKACIHALAAGAEIREYHVAETKFFTMAIHVYILDALGQQTQADQVLQNMTEMIEKGKAYYLNYNLDALRTRRRLGQGDRKAAERWLREHEPPLYNGLDFYKYYGHITACRAYITKADYDSAVILLKKVLALADAYNRPLDRIEARLLLSVAYWKMKRGYQKEALSVLEQAVSEAYTFGYTQIFINEGEELCGMLRRLQRSVEQRPDGKTAPASFIKMLYLKTMTHPGAGLHSGQSEPPQAFTDKQRAVMKLLCEGKSYREMTEALGIKLPTLRSHIALIYKKLGVTGETDAIKKIKALGLFSDI